MLNFDTLSVEDLIPYLRNIATNPEANDRDKEFADSLVNGKWGWGARGFLTEKQEAAARRMLDRILNRPAPETAPAMVGVHSFLKNAKRYLKYPKLWLQLADGTPVKVYMSGARSKYPDTVNLKVGQYDDWYGRILDTGEWHRPRSAEVEVVGQLKTLLEELAADPAGVAAAYGKITGHCCFCHQPLSDERSLDVGFGPVCADHYDLKEQWKNGDGATAKAMMMLRKANPYAGRRVRVKH